ncbi:molybdenum cofactor cytidylyltransferase [Zobellia uliginosa]|uniref:Molybdenum cofactor cytidylyltransferase n=1 Tax=Zobellia uliginosa TaxID=143224 RepID=A0ABY1KT58_9FLAO|nr:nucleotidyltransferase family protein [Zobellia uliginosa]SIS74018.1 molybdenum cofactor cytidylyltransferase [Zobellia uliginosa]
MKSAPHRIAILILAAGSSSRMGKPKQLLPWHDTTLLGHAIRTAKASKAIRALTVLGANAKKIRTETTEAFAFTENTAWESGMGSSIAHGAASLMASDKDIEGILIMLADQPLIKESYLNLLIDHSIRHKDKIIATTYKHRAGVPALFPKPYFEALLKLNKDFGAKQLLQEEENQVIRLSAGQNIIDIDTSEDYERLKHKNETEH